MEVSRLFNDKFEKFDIQWLEENAEKRELIEMTSYVFRQKTDSGFILIDGNQKRGYWFFQFFNNDYFALHKYFYPSGKIQEKGWASNWSGVKKGLWYEYDTNGKLIKTTDYDKLTKFSIEDVVNYCRIENIPLRTGHIESMTGFHAAYNRYYDEEMKKYNWVIRIRKSYEFAEMIYLDGDTGKEIKRIEKQMSFE